MREIAIIGIGQTVIAEQWEKSLRELAGRRSWRRWPTPGASAWTAFFVGNMLSGPLNRQENLGALVADWVGLRGTEAVKVEAACGSGAAALRAGLMAVGSGEMDSAVVVGVEKMTDTVGSRTTAGLASGRRRRLGSRAGAVVRGHQRAGDAPLSARVRLEAHRLRPVLDQRPRQRACTTRMPACTSASATADYNRARMVADPINLLDASPIGDGAAAVVLVPAESLRRNGHPLITIAGSASATDSLAVHDRPRPAVAGRRRQFGAQGLCPGGRRPGRHPRLRAARRLFHHGRPVAGGQRLCRARPGAAPGAGWRDWAARAGAGGHARRAKARGHPVGATGMYQIVEVVQQLRGEAGDTQVPDEPKIGMAQNIGGSGATILTHILRAN